MTFSVSKCLISTSELNLYLMKINVQYTSNEQHADLEGGGGSWHLFDNPIHNCLVEVQYMCMVSAQIHVAWECMCH